MAKGYHVEAVGPDEPASHAAAITPSDSVDLSEATRAIWVGGAGDVRLITSGGETVTISGVSSGTVVPVRATRVLSTSTTATLMVALW